MTSSPETPSTADPGSLQADRSDASSPPQLSSDAPRAEAPAVDVRMLPVQSIRANSRQPRQVFDEDALRELETSIDTIGLLQPVLVRPAPGGDGFELVAGERRFRCVRHLGWDTVPALVRHTEDTDLLRDALLENLHRADLNPLEEAAAYQQLLVDLGCTQEELSLRIGRSRPQISNTIRLLRLPAGVQRRVAAGVLSQGHARALLALPDEAAMEALASRIVAEGLSVRSVEEIVAVGGDAEPTRPTRRPRRTTSAPGLHETAERLSDHLDTRVSVTMGRVKGRVTIEFAGHEDLERILDLLVGGGSDS